MSTTESKSSKVGRRESGLDEGGLTRSGRESVRDFMATSTASPAPSGAEFAAGAGSASTIDPRSSALSPRPLAGGLAGGRAERGALGPPPGLLGRGPVPVRILDARKTGTAKGRKPVDSTACSRPAQPRGNQAEKPIESKRLQFERPLHHAASPTSVMAPPAATSISKPLLTEHCHIFCLNGHQPYQRISTFHPFRTHFDKSPLHHFAQ